MITNDTTALMNTPTPNRLLLIVKASAEKSGTPPRAPISGVIKLLTNASTTSLNAAPTTTATARSTTVPPAPAISGRARSVADARHQARDRQYRRAPARRGERPLHHPARPG